MKRRITATAAALALALGVSGCGDPGERIEAGAVSAVVPEGWTDVSDTPVAENGWEIAFTDSREEPSGLMRLSGDLGRAPAADTTLSTLQGETIFNQSYGSDFAISSSTNIDIRRADRALEVEFGYIGDNGVEYEGVWWLMSARSARATSAVEITGVDLSEEQINAVRDSIEYRP